MKIQLDFTNKIITIESNVNLFDFMKRIKKVLPDWKEWELNVKSETIYWANPIPWDWHLPYPVTYNQADPYFETTSPYVNVSSQTDYKSIFLNLY